MLIQIMRDKKHYDYVKGATLDRMIAMKMIEKFKRSSGWVTIGVDPTRDESKIRDIQKSD